MRLQIRAWQEHVVPSELARGDADLMLGFTPRASRSATTRAPLFEDRFVFVARKGHPKVRGRITLATYTKLAHVLVSHEPNARGVVDDVLAQRGLTRNVALRVSHFLLVPPILATTDYVAAQSELVVRPCADSLKLQLLKMPFDVPRRHGPDGVARADGGLPGARLAARASWGRWGEASRCPVGRCSGKESGEFGDRSPGGRRH